MTDKPVLSEGEVFVGLGSTWWSNSDTGHGHEVDPDEGIVRCALCADHEGRAAATTFSFELHPEHEFYLRREAQGLQMSSEELVVLVLSQHTEAFKARSAPATAPETAPARPRRTSR